LHLVEAEGAVGVHGDLDAVVAEEFLDELCLVPGTFEVSWDAVPEEVRADVLRVAVGLVMPASRSAFATKEWNYAFNRPWHTMFRGMTERG
jgi:hypothetical protein